MRHAPLIFTGLLAIVRQRRMNELLTISREVSAEGDEAEERLRAKCRWEAMSRTAVIREWGDPRTWPPA